MAAQIVDGKKIAEEIKAEIKNEVAALKEEGIIPHLAVILVGNDPASVIYAQTKEKLAAKLDIKYTLYHLKEETNEEEVLNLIKKLNQEQTVHGIMVEMPLPKEMNKERVLEAIDPLKDIDGAHPINRGYLLSGAKGLFPATPQACIEVLLRNKVELKGKHAVIVGRGETVGKPLVFMILAYHPTVTICHSRTIDLAYHTKQADILIAAVGKPKMITKEMIKEGAVVVDAGINQLEDGSICGDVDFEGAEEVASLITPVPGGVGSITTSLLLKNLIRAISLQKEKGGLGRG